MSGSATSPGYSAAEAAALLAIPLARFRALAKAGYASMGGCPERFHFQDLVLLRAAQRLKERKVPTRRIARALANLKSQLPADRPLSSIVLVAEGEELLARDGQAHWNPESGQVVFDFRSDALAERLASLKPHPSLEALFDRAVELEEPAPQAAIALYTRVLERSPLHVDALINLGRLHYARGKTTEARALFERAVAAAPDDAIAAFNHAITLEDVSESVQAIAEYTRALSLDPSLADAYFNLARLYERLGQKTAALRHLKEYHRRSRPS